MTHFVRHGSVFSVTSDAAIDIHDRLPAGTYTVKYDQMNERFYLEMIDGFKNPAKIYGDSHRHALRILKTFGDRENGTGVLLAGEQGSGKTLLAKMLSTMGRELGIPTIVVNKPWCGENFNVFIQTIEQPTIILFDEFEKVYDETEQEKMLTLLDGVYPTKKLFVLTCNDTYRINKHMKNRPGRIFYRLDYKGLDVDFIREYCEDNLNDKSYIDSLCRISMAYDRFNFDMLKAIVEEMNRYEESPKDVIALLNTKPEVARNQLYDVVLTLEGNPIPGHEGIIAASPLLGCAVDYPNPFFDQTIEDSEEEITVHFTADDLVKLDSDQGTFNFKNADGFELSLKRQTVQSYQWSDAF